MSGSGPAFRRADSDKQIHMFLQLPERDSRTHNIKHRQRKSHRKSLSHPLHPRPEVPVRDTSRQPLVLQKSGKGRKNLAETERIDRTRHQGRRALYCGPENEKRHRPQVLQDLRLRLLIFISYDTDTATNLQ